MAIDLTAFTGRFVQPPHTQIDSDPAFGTWADFVALMEAVEALCGEWPPAATDAFIPAPGPFLM